MKTYSEYFTLLGCRCRRSLISIFAYHILRVVLRIWDVLPDEARGGMTSQPPQPVQELSEIRSLLTLLELILKAFEVAILSLLDIMLR